MNLQDIFVQVQFKFDQMGVETAKKSVKSFEQTANSLQFVDLLAKITAIRYAFNAVSWAIRNAAGFFTTFLEAAGEKQRIQIGFEVLTGNVIEAKKVLQELWDLALVTPFTVPDIEKQSMMLTAMGFELKDLASTMAILADVTAGLPNLTLERLAVNLGQVKSATYMTGKELKDFWRGGIPMSHELTLLPKFKGKTEGQIIDLVSKRMVSFNDVMQVFVNLTSKGGRFYKMAEEMMTTLPGRWSNFLDQMILFKRTIGEGITPLASDLMARAMNFFAANKDTIKTVFIDTLTIVAKTLYTIGSALWAVGETVVWILGLFGEYKTVLKTIGLIILTMFSVSALVAFKGAALALGVKLYAIGFAIYNFVLMTGAALGMIVTGNLGAATLMFATALKTSAVGTALAVGGTILGLVSIFLLIQDIYMYITKGDSANTMFGYLFSNENSFADSPALNLVKAVVSTIIAAAKGVGILFLLLSILFGFSDMSMQQLMDMLEEDFPRIFGQTLDKMKERFSNFVEEIGDKIKANPFLNIFYGGFKLALYGAPGSMFYSGDEDEASRKKKEAEELAKRQAPETMDDSIDNGMKFGIGNKHNIGQTYFENKENFTPNIKVDITVAAEGKSTKQVAEQISQYCQDILCEIPSLGKAQ